MKLRSNSGGTLYGGVVIIDPSDMEDDIDYGGMLYELKKRGIRDGEAYQISNGGVILMYRNAYEKCKDIIRKFEVTVEESPDTV